MSHVTRLSFAKVLGKFLWWHLHKREIWIFLTFFHRLFSQLKFIYSENATKFCKISTIDLSHVVPVKSTMEISQNFEAFSEYMDFTYILMLSRFSHSHYIKRTSKRIFKTGKRKGTPKERVSSVPFPFWFPFQLQYELVSSGISSQSVQNILN